MLHGSRYVYLYGHACRPEAFTSGAAGAGHQAGQTKKEAGNYIASFLFLSVAIPNNICFRQVI